MVYGKKAKSQLADLVTFCRTKKEKLEREYMAAVGSFPRPDDPGVLKTIFGSKGHEPEMTLEALEKKVKEHDARAKDLKSAKIMQRLFRGNKYAKQKRDEDLARLDEIAVELQRRGEAYSVVTAQHLREEEVQRDRLYENEASRSELRAQRDKHQRYAVKLGDRWEEEKNKIPVLEDRIATLTEAIEDLRQEIINGVPRTWGILNRKAAQEQEASRVSSLEKEIEAKTKEVETQIKS